MTLVSLLRLLKIVKTPLIDVYRNTPFIIEYIFETFFFCPFSLMRYFPNLNINFIKYISTIYNS
jgi:hypothetical protein